MKKYIIIWWLGLIATIIAAFISSNTRSNGEQKVIESYELEQMIIDYHYHLEKENEHKTQRELLGDNISDKCAEMWIECRAGEQGIDYNKQGYPTGSLGKVEQVDMNGNPIASMYIPWGKPLPPVHWNTKAKRFTNFVRYYANGFDESVFVEARNKYGVKEEVLACIAWSETTLGNANKSTSNIMNYGNNDRWNTRDYTGVLENVLATAHGIAQGKYMWGNQILWEMSWGGRAELWLPSCAEAKAPNKCYATSMENWHRNMLNCITFIVGEKQTAHYEVKKDLLAYNQ